jgi:hypothetical protein
VARGEGGASDVDVVLVEEDDVASSARFAPARRVRPGGPSRRRLGVGLAVAVAVVAGSSTVQAWQERAGLAALSTVPGVVPRVTAQPEIAWTLESGQLRDSSDETLLVDSTDGSGTAAVDVASGEVLWRSRDAGPGSGWTDCRFLRADRARSFWGAGLVDGAADEVLCAHRGLRSGPELIGSVPELATLVQVLDARTGAVRAERAVAGESVLVETIGDDVVLAGHDADGLSEVVRWDPRSDVDRWTYRGDVGGGRTGAGFGAWVAGEHLVLQDGAGARLLSLDDGVVVPETAAGRVVLPIVDLADGATVEIVGLLGPGTSAVVVREAHGAVRLELEGWYGGPPVLDPRTPVLLVTGPGGDLTAHDVLDGAVRWTRPDGTAATAPLPTWQPDTPLVLVGDVLVLTSAGQVEAVDAQEGTALWTVEELEVSAYGALTDGRSVVLPARDRPSGGAPGLLVALDLRDGSEVWRVPLPEPGVAVRQAGEMLVVQGERGVVALRR